ncbi:MAG: hypothetical protein D6770_09430, partial [Anaerolineae bacterium]
PTTPPADEWSLWVDGTHLRGANIYQRRVFDELDEGFLGPGPLGPPYTQADFDALAAAGANYVNLSVPGLFTVQPPYEPDPDVVATVDRLLEMAASADLYVVLSARTGPLRSEFSILRDGAGDWFGYEYLIEKVWEDTEAQAAWAAMWRYTAERYRDNPIVIGYDLMVEPNSNDILDIWDPDEFYRQYGGTTYDWNTWYPPIVQAIREVDPDTPILVGGMGYSGLEWLPYLQPVDDPRVVYTFHQYEPFVYTHQEPGEGLTNTYPGRFDADWDEEAEDVNRAWLDSFFALGDLYAAQYGVPLAVNECGVMRWEPGAADFMRDQLDLFERRGWNVAVWMWYPDWPPLATPDGDHDFNFRFGPDPANLTPTSNDLFAVYREFWSHNTLRPSGRR